MVKLLCKRERKVTNVSTRKLNIMLEPRITDYDEIDMCMNAVIQLKQNSLNRRETGWPVERGGHTRYSSINWY